MISEGSWFVDMTIILPVHLCDELPVVKSCNWVCYCSYSVADFNIILAYSLTAVGVGLLSVT